jgi:hypothetical protein
MTAGFVFMRWLRMGSGWGPAARGQDGVAGKPDDGKAEPDEEDVGDFGEGPYIDEGIPRGGA